MGQTSAMPPDADQNSRTEIGRAERELRRAMHSYSTLIVKPAQEPLLRDLGKYQLREVLGCGGQSVAFKGWDRDLLRHIVIKVYHNASSDAEHQLILTEGRALARVRHPGVCTCLAIDRIGEMPYLVLPFIPGETLRDRLARDSFSDDTSVKIVLDLCDAVAAIHRCGLLHCDLKPANIMIDSNNCVTVIDLGLATTQLSLTPDDVAGTPAYLAPERANGDVEDIDERCDVFGLGAILYELLSGRAPFADSTRSGSRALSKRGIVPDVKRFRDDLGLNLVRVLMRSVARFPGQRFRDVGSFAKALREAVTDTPS